MIQQALNQALSTGLAGAYLYSQTPRYSARVKERSINTQQAVVGTKKRQIEKSIKDFEEQIQKSKAAGDMVNATDLENTVAELKKKIPHYDEKLEELDAAKAENRLQINSYDEKALKTTGEALEKKITEEIGMAEEEKANEDVERQREEIERQRQAAASEQAALDRYYSRANGQMVQAQSLQERLALLRESAKKGAK